VTSPADAGPGTLRQALLDAQRGDTVTFDPPVFPLEAPRTITVLSGLPSLVQGQINLDASNAGVVLDGSRVPREEHPAAGLTVHSSGNRIVGLQVLNFPGAGVEVRDGQDNRIGDAGPGERNVISGNWDGVNLTGNGTMHNVVSGNYIGTDASGTAALGNKAGGVWVGDGAQYNLVGGTTAAGGNLISGNSGNGVIIDGSRYNTISGNLIGTDASGTRALANEGVGVGLAWGAQHNQVGGNAPGEGNVISGNTLEGVYAGDAGTMYNQVSGNIIGLDASGLAPLPNGWSGVNLAEGARDNLIGGATAAEANLIGANGGDGVTMAGAGVRDNVVRGNYIGTDATGEARLGNQQDGIGVADGAGPNTIGPGNIIAYNAQAGVAVSGSGTEGNTITTNAIYDNGGPGIETGAGGNAGISPPQLRSVSSRVAKGAAPPGATIEVFYDEGEEGRIFAGSTLAGEDGAFAYTVPVGAFRGPGVLVTATDSEGNTSAFSAPGSPPATALLRELPQVVGPAQVSTDPKVVSTNLGLALICILVFGWTSTYFNKTLEEYGHEIASGLGRLLPQRWAERLRAVDRAPAGIAARGRGGLLLMWLVVMLVTALIESFLDPTIGLLGPERLGLLVTLFFSGVVVSGLELAVGLGAHARWAPATGTQINMHWLGLGLAIACVILSRALRFVPGYLYGIVGAVYLRPKLTGTARPGKRAILVLSAVLAGSLGLWIATVFLPPALGWLEPVLLTTFLAGLQGTFFEMFPLAVTDGGDVWRWRKRLWCVLFLAVSFCMCHFVLNPNASIIQALQQNGVQTLVVLMVVFGLITALLWVLVRFRLGRKQRRADKPHA
jgi:hypothetical protein